MKRFLALLLALVFLVPLCAAAEKAAPTLDERVDRLFRIYGTTGGEVVVARDGEIVYQRCYGHPLGKKDESMTPDHYYRIASVSKLVTATAVMRLVETGRLDLDENIGEYLRLEGEKPFFAASRRFRQVGITARMLMSHTSCIFDSNFPQKIPLREAIDVKTAYVSTFYEEKPGTKYHYSNYGAGILGCLIEAITGQLLDEAVRDLIFQPMGLDAGYSPEYLEHPENMTSGVVRTYGPEIDIDHDYYLSYGNCWMKCSDLCKIGMMLCDYGRIGDQQILQEDTVREMLSSQKGKGGITVDSPYGLNVQRLTLKDIFPDRTVYGHQGRIDNILCNLYFDPETRFVFALVTCNCNPGDIVNGIRYPSYGLLQLLAGEFAAAR